MKSEAMIFLSIRWRNREKKASGWRSSPQKSTPNYFRLYSWFHGAVILRGGNYGSIPSWRRLLIRHGRQVPLSGIAGYASELRKDQDSYYSLFDRYWSTSSFWEITFRECFDLLEKVKRQVLSRLRTITHSSLHRVLNLNIPFPWIFRTKRKGTAEQTFQD